MSATDRDYFLSLGSDIEPATHLPLALERLQEIFQVECISPIYETPPMGMEGDAVFWNAAVKIKSALSQEGLKKKLRSLEKDLGRTRDPNNKFTSRTIDIDIVPHPGFEKDSFVVIPLADIAPQDRDPATGASFQALARPHLKQLEIFRKISPAKFKNG